MTPEIEYNLVHHHSLRVVQAEQINGVYVVMAHYLGFDQAFPFRLLATTDGIDIGNPLLCANEFTIKVCYDAEIERRTRKEAA